MTPFYFGQEQRRLYGAYHPAAQSSGPPRAAVLCYPWGPEYVEAHRAVRQLAASLAAAGIHALRFDYYGTGDSGGETAEGEFVGWRDDILTAIHEVREISGAERVILIGLRLGALLAAAAAAEQPDLVETVVLWDPLDSSDYLAELRETALRYNRATWVPVPRASAEGDGYEVFGFEVDAALASRFAELDLAPIVARLRAPTVLVVSGGEDAFAEIAGKLGRERLLAALHVPARPCWIDDTSSAPGFVPRFGAEQHRPAGRMTDFAERVARFGPNGSLVGIFAVPTSGRADLPTIVIVNTGIVHRVGHHRMYVAFARTLASAGFPVLRFDLSGLGDSPVREPAPDPVEAGNADLRDALDWLHDQGHSDFVLMGLCSGADRSVVYAGIDARVRGLILLDPSIPPTPRFLRNLIRRHLVSAMRANPVPTLVRKLRRVTMLLWRSRSGDQPVAGPAAWLETYQIRRFLEACYARAIANGASMLAIFTSGMQQLHNYPEQILDAFPRIDFDDRLSLHYLEGVDHLFVLERERALCLRTILDWLQRHPAGAQDDPQARRYTPAPAQSRETTRAISA